MRKIVREDIEQWYNLPPSPPHLSSREILLPLEFQADGVVGREAHGVDNGDSSTQFVQGILNDVFCQTHSCSHLSLVQWVHGIIIVTVILLW